MTIGMVTGVAIGVLLGYRLMTMAGRIWRAWEAHAQAEQEAERQRFDRIMQANAPTAPGLRRSRKRVG